jgi:hypothetical protein
MHYSPRAAPTCAQCHTSMKLECIAPHTSTQNALVHRYRCMTCHLPDNIIATELAATGPCARGAGSANVHFGCIQSNEQVKIGSESLLSNLAR